MLLLAEAAGPDAWRCWLAVGTWLALLGLVVFVFLSTGVVYEVALAALAVAAPKPLQQPLALTPELYSTLLAQNGLMTKSTAARSVFPTAWRVAGAQELAAT